jgi:AcrR family transcriptional regulator
MADQKQTRPYRKRRRAELEAQTRLRITESAVDLHSTLGPSRTSISAVAERAGVRRSTVYRHFPDETALFAACSAHWMASNLPPDLEAWAAIEAPEERIRSALEELYAYYSRTEPMLEKLYRDEQLMPTVKRQFVAFREYLEAARVTLLRGRTERGRARSRTAAAVGHALSFASWRSLTREQGLDDAQAADLMSRLVVAAKLPEARTPAVSARPRERSISV